MGDGGWGGGKHWVGCQENLLGGVVHNSGLFLKVASGGGGGTSYKMKATELTGYEEPQERGTLSNESTDGSLNIGGSSECGERG